MLKKRSKNNFLGALLHLSDPTLPIGGYSHSNGLETYVQQGIVNSVESAKTFVVNTLQYNIKYNDASLLRLAYEATIRKDIQALIDLDQACSALKAPREIREASQKLGLRLIKLYRRKNKFDWIDQYEQAIRDKQATGHYCIVFGVYAQLLDFPLQESLLAFYYNAASGLITNNVKLIPLGQLDGQDIMFDIQPLLGQLATETLSVTQEQLGMCNPGFDIRSMQHERLYSRLYMS